VLFTEPEIMEVQDAWCALALPGAHDRITMWVQDVLAPGSEVSGAPTTSTDVEVDTLASINGDEDAILANDDEDAVPLRREDMMQDFDMLALPFEHGWALQHMLIHGPSRLNDDIGTLRPTLLRLSLNAIAQELLSGECLHVSK
jgi:hypothetical protein